MGSLIDSLISFADQHFRQTAVSPNCSSLVQQCTTDDAQACLKAVHYSGRKQEYKCYKMLEYYIPAFLPEYASEIEIALNKDIYPTGIPNNLRVVSIGAGASPDLCAIDSILKKIIAITPTSRILE